MNRYEKRKGVFKPKNLETLKPGLEVHIGKEFYFSYAWTVDEEDGGPYVGQTAYTVHQTRKCTDFGEGIIPRMGWIPTEDIEFLETPL